jgi:hypothetical protein
VPVIFILLLQHINFQNFFSMDRLAFPVALLDHFTMCYLLLDKTNIRSDYNCAAFDESLKNSVPSCSCAFKSFRGSSQTAQQPTY